MRVPVLMFDFGNVVAGFDYLRMFDRFGARLGISGEELQARMNALGFPSLLSEFESGALDAPEFTRRFQAQAATNVPADEFAADWGDIFELNDPVANLIVFLKERGYTLLLGSNTNALHAAFYRRKFRSTLDHFDHFVFSHEVGRLKPDPSFFKACLSAVDAPASSCIFIDDAPANVRGAIDLGLIGLQFRDASTLINDLIRQGVEVPGNQA